MSRYLPKFFASFKLLRCLFIYDFYNFLELNFCEKWSMSKVLDRTLHISTPRHIVMELFFWDQKVSPFLTIFNTTRTHWCLEWCWYPCKLQQNWAWQNLKVYWKTNIGKKNFENLPTSVGVTCYPAPAVLPFLAAWLVQVSR